MLHSLETRGADDVLLNLRLVVSIMYSLDWWPCIWRRCYINLKLSGVDDLLT
jgi:hypothetical protein